MLDTPRDWTPLWQGFDCRWLSAPHRLNHITSAVDTKDTADQATLRTRFTVGRVPDRGTLTTRVAGLHAPGVAFIDGEVRAILLATAGQVALFEGAPITVPLPTGPDTVATIVLRGFEIGCTSSPVGLHAQGFGVQLADAKVVGSALRFVPRMFVHATPSPDLLTGWRGVYSYEMVAPYTVIYGAAERLAVHAPGSPTASAHRKHRRPTSHSGTISGHGGDRFAFGATAIHGFSWSLGHRGRFGRDGRFLRHLATWIDASEYDAARGAMDITSRLAFSNKGLLTYGVQARQRLWTTVLQVCDGATRPSQAVTTKIATGLGDGAGEVRGVCL